MKKIKILILLCVVVTGRAIAQDEIVDYPKVGEQIKDHTFIDLEDYPAKSVKVSDFRGKWLILDFWAFSCSSCIASFPKMDKLAKKFKDQVQLIMVGSASEPKWNIRNKGMMYERKRAAGFTFSVAYDLTTFSKYDIRALPYILVVDPYGVIVAKTTSVNEDQISELLTGNKPAFSRAFSAHEKLEYDENLPLLTTGNLANGGKDNEFTMRSLLLPYTYKMPFINAVAFTSKRHARLKEHGVYEATRIALRDYISLPI